MDRASNEFNFSNRRRPLAARSPVTPPPWPTPEAFHAGVSQPFLASEQKRRAGGAEFDGVSDAG